MNSGGNANFSTHRVGNENNNISNMPAPFSTKSGFTSHREQIGQGLLGSGIPDLYITGQRGAKPAIYCTEEGLE